jgi:hypothetical protein
VRDDVEAAADVIRPHIALYAGGMGAKEANFHKQSLDRLGYQEPLDKVQELYLAGRKEEAAAAVPTQLVEEIALVGPIDKIRRELPTWERTAITTMLVQGDPASMLALLSASQDSSLGGRVRSTTGALLSRVAPKKV